MTKGDLYKVAIVLKNVGMIKEGVKAKFSYGIAKNRGMIQDEIDCIEEARKKLQPFQKENQAILVKYADKDEKGKPVVKNGFYQGIDESEGSEYSKEIAALKAAHQKDIDDVEALLKEELKEAPKWHKIKLADVPDGVSGYEMETLMDMIDDSEPEKK